MSSTISENVPVLQPEHIVGHSEDDTRTRKLPQSIRIPDLYQKFSLSPHPSRLVRYHIKIDHSFLNQSYAVAEVWSSHGVGWVELCKLKVEQEFYIIQGPDRSALDPRTRELTHAFDSDKADYIAKSWQKVVNLLAAEAQEVLEAATCP